MEYYAILTSERPMFAESKAFAQLTELLFAVHFTEELSLVEAKIHICLVSRLNVGFAKVNLITGSSCCGHQVLIRLRNKP